MNTEFMINTVLGNLIVLLICLIGMVIFFKFILGYLDKSKQKKKVRKQRVIKNPYKYFRLPQPVLLQPGESYGITMYPAVKDGEALKGPVILYGEVVSAIPIVNIETHRKGTDNEAP